MLVTNVYCGKRADSIEMPFGVAGRVDQRNHIIILDGVQLTHRNGLCFLGGVGKPVA